jgi:hypothetical protein
LYKNPDASITDKVRLQIIAYARQILAKMNLLPGQLINIDDYINKNFKTDAQEAEEANKAQLANVALQNQMANAELARFNRNKGGSNNKNNNKNKTLKKKHINIRLV